MQVMNVKFDFIVYYYIILCIDAVVLTVYVNSVTLTL